MDVHPEWGMVYTGGNETDTRHNIPFRYYQTGSPFEYELARFFFTKKRQLEVDQ